MTATDTATAIPRLTWQRVELSDQFTARTADGVQYSVCDLEKLGYRDGGFSARYRPPQGRARSPKDPINLGNVRSMEAAKALCEQHAAARGEPSRGAL